MLYGNKCFFSNVLVVDVLVVYVVNDFEWVYMGGIIVFFIDCKKYFFLIGIFFEKVGLYICLFGDVFFD